MAGEITLRELSPQLREFIENSGGGGSINADIKTCGFTAEKGQTTFTIPFENYIAEECYLDVKVNSIWVSPDEYSINGKEVTFNTALEVGTEVFFTVYLLGATAVSSVNADVVVENENKKFVTSQEKSKIAEIDVLNSKINGFTIYTKPTDIPNLPSPYTMNDIANCMADNSKFIYSFAGSELSIFDPTNLGLNMVEITRCSSIRIFAMGYRAYATVVQSHNKIWTSSYNTTSGFTAWRQLATTDDAIMNTPINLGRTESTTTQAIYTVTSDIALGRMYCFSTGASPSGSVQEIIFRTPQGDYTLKIADTNTVDTMSNATWGDFNAGTRVLIYFAERNSVKGAVITSPSYGYLNSKNVTTSTDDCTVNGKYYGSSSVLNLPESYSWVMDVIRYNDNFIYQTIHMGSGRVFFRLKISSGWQPWQEIATTTKTPFSCTASTGYTILWQDCYILNGRKYINVRIKKSDDTLFEAKQHAIFTTPYGTLNRIPLTIMPYGDTKFNMMGSTFQNGVLWYGKQVYITPTSATAYGFEVKCEFDN